MIVNVNVIPCFHRHDFPFQPFFQITVSLNVSLNVFNNVSFSGSKWFNLSFNIFQQPRFSRHRPLKKKATGPGGSKAMLLLAPETSGLLHQ